MSRRRRRKHRSDETQAKDQNFSRSEQKTSITSFLKKVNFPTLSTQLRNIADNMEKFGEMSVLFDQVDILVQPKQGNKKGSFDLMKLLQNKDSLNHLLQALLPVIISQTEKKVAPVNVEAINEEE